VHPAKGVQALLFWPRRSAQEETSVKTAKDVLALLGLLFVGYVALAMCEALGLVHLAMGGH
jgi:hypothetical protein